MELLGFDAGSPQNLPDPLAGATRPSDQIHLPRPGPTFRRHGLVKFGAGLLNPGAGIGLDLPGRQHDLFFRLG
ncbi:hypothetical protein AB0C50_18150 [Micromonospora taraxaci]|uniref:hypothetical protein n=1 Tax=Micromonospora taraxaci TaxID=1316803 RepID=UPI0033EFA8A9